MIDVEKVTSSLKKSESTRLEIERQLFKYKKDYGTDISINRDSSNTEIFDQHYHFFPDTLKDQLKRCEEKEKNTNEDLQTCRDKLMSANKEKIMLLVCISAQLRVLLVTRTNLLIL